ncbi:MAG TPA: YIP1 family protein [Vicinamibacterales bacterium]|nr:YIP1 family protein [Vicinamibacterales bacterium]
MSARILGVLRRPRQTLQEVASHPRWAPLLVTLTLVTAAAGAAVSATEVGQLALVDQWERTALAFGQAVDDSRYADLLAWSRLGPAVAAGNALLAGPGLAVVVSLLVFAWLRLRGAAAANAAAQGNTVSYSQVLAVVVHAGVVLAVGRLVAAPLVYARETTASATTVGAWFPSLDEASAAARFLGAIDLFTLWWAVVLGIGVAVLSGRRARTCALGIMSVYVGLALVAAAVMAMAA